MKKIVGIAALALLAGGALAIVLPGKRVDYASPQKPAYHESASSSDAAPASIRADRHISLLPFLSAALFKTADQHLARPITVLVAGVPGKGNPAPNLTDTILVVHADPIIGRIVLFSLPRDLLVKPSDATYYTKLNGLYERRGITALRLKAEEITGLEITRYIVIDLAAVREIVDALDGVNIFLEKDLHDPRFPSNGFGYETFELKSGWRYLDGLTASRFIRTRNDPEGDFGRMKRQQMLLEALKQKITGLSIVWDMPTFLKIFESIDAHIETNITTDELFQFFEWGKNISGDPVILAPLDADREKHLFTTGDFWFGEVRASIVKPIEGIENYDAIRGYVETILTK
ncbi:MAG: LCP family protein [bacterium]|nr:LCP family protein [bacterium]